MAQLKSRTLFMFDLDGTVTSEEILPLIAKEAELYDEISALTEATIKGIIPFDNSFKLRCRLLRDVPLSRVHKVVNNVKVYEQVAKFIQAHQDNCVIITGNLDVWVTPLRTRFYNIYTSEAMQQDGKLHKVTKVMQKDEMVQYLKTKYYGKIDRYVAIGDGMGDVAMFAEADMTIAFGGTHKPVESLVKMSNYVLTDEHQLVNLLEQML